MADIYAKVARQNYTFRGHKLRKGTLVKVSKEQLDSAKKKVPPNLEKADAPKKGETFVDLTLGFDMPQAQLPVEEKGK